MKKIHFYCIFLFVLLGSFSSVFGQLTANRAGKLDTSFAGQGYAGLPVPDGMFVVTETHAKAPDGKVVVVSNNTGFETALHRVLANGELDQSFGSGGYVTIETEIGGRNSPALAIQSDGKILVGGFKGVVSSGQWIVDSYVVRLNTDGSIDTDFGNNGWVVRDLSAPGELSNDRYEAAFIKPNSKILLVGLSDRYASPGRTRTYLTLTQLNSDGSLDASFAQNGVSMVEIGNGESDRLMSGTVKARLLRSGKVAILISQKVFESPKSQNYQYFTKLFRFEENGQIDVGFSQNGSQSFSTGQFIWPPCGFDEDSEGNLYFVLPSSGTLRKLKPNGESDQTFGFGGIIHLFFWTPSDLAVGRDGKIILMGRDRDVIAGNPNQYRSALRRYYPDGSLDIKFGQQGSAFFAFGSNEFRKLLVDDDGSFLISGYYYPTQNRTAPFIARVVASRKP
ncbi:MAG: hypothetical protein HOP17_09435 [Acidobacteria bacterium]|nr:hypothetical protein [Acidobacteriota bacterium]